MTCYGNSAAISTVEVCKTIIIGLDDDFTISQDTEHDFYDAIAMPHLMCCASETSQVLSPCFFGKSL